MFAKHTFAIWFITIITIPLSLYADTNLLTNPGFENGTTGWVSRSCSITTVTTPVYSGSRSARAYSRTATWHGIQQNMLDKMMSGNTYQISGKIRTSTSASSTVKITVQKTENGTTTYSNVATGTASNSGWTSLSGNYNYTTSGTVTELYVYFEGPASGIDIYVDDANVFGPSPSSQTNASATITPSTRYQILEGFGAAGAWYEQTVLNYSSTIRTNLYNTMFRDLGLDIYRVRNTYGIDNGYITRSATIIQAAATSLGHPIRVMNSSWGPPASLKSNNDFENGGTLIKDANGNYKYTEFAQWWRDSLTAWTNAGVNIYYLNMQNEPTWSATWHTCLWDPTETSTYAGYKQGFAALYANLNTMPNRPKLLAPESQDTTHVASFLNALDATDKSNVYGYSHHLYDGSADTPDQLVSQMAAIYSQFHDKPIFQTEFSGGTTTTWTNAMNLAMLMNNCLTVENVSAYLYWDLFWASPSGLISLTTPNFTVNPIYYAFKHFSYFTDPNWQRIGITINAASVRTSAFISPDNNQVTIVAINTSTSVDYNTVASLGNFQVDSGSVYRSSSSENFVLVGEYNGTIMLPKNSITTITLKGKLIPQNCQEVQNFGYALLSDINGDCSVNYEDLYVLAGYWLRTDCDENNNCGGADFETADGDVDFIDFAKFAEQWMACNDPQTAGCTTNW
jgi:glucuronoarabinoxylan endo-1,4-beta-xylanase